MRSNRPSDLLEMRVYTGADGDITLHEDDGDANDHEKRAFATILIHRNAATHRLILGPRKGWFPGNRKRFR